MFMFSLTLYFPKREMSMIDLISGGKWMHALTQSVRASAARLAQAVDTRAGREFS